MSKISTFLLGLLTVGALHEAKAQALQNNTQLHIQADAGLYVQGAMINAGTANLQNNGTLSVTGNLTNDQSTYNAFIGKLVFAGNSPQVLDGSRIWFTKDFEINNAAGLTMTSSFYLRGTATFTNGIVTMANASHSIFFDAASATQTGAKDASHVANGYVHKLGTGAFSFPVGNGTKLQKIDVNLTANSNYFGTRYAAADAGSGTYGTTGAKATQLMGYNTGEYWQVGTNGGTATGQVTVYWDGTNDANAATTSVRRVARKVGTEWLNEGGLGTGTTAAGSVTSSSISFPTSTMFPIAMGWENVVLPLSWLNVNATDTKDQNVQVQWQVSESNVTTYIVERNTGAGFIEVATVASKGNGTNSYNLTDIVRNSGSIYYRIKQIDQDGTSSYSDVFDVRIAALGKLAIFPNPVISQLSVDSDKKQDAKIYNVQGQQVKELKLVEGRNKVELDHLPNGVYFLRTVDGVVTKLIKSNK
ncbi:T9SS type A sorting domain-containing protein [Pedobacter xixiisoli]|uniref:Por secretion system C-terminal sorting domain-containing protein n=1 Tax=Pedobacter xixiisoli TaxID=1476464 RepID=A0A286AE90_9SPHI|nr:T9SS type A sorting domain-containing protein [Pedobacter xixiisoli]SOD20215.1 Por secretion system C-terminal sorting domain-containing protein [Pedobacter xixiisoli]